jgi:hypothetical protein
MYSIHPQAMPALRRLTFNTVGGMLLYSRSAKIIEIFTQNAYAVR